MIKITALVFSALVLLAGWSREAPPAEANAARSLRIYTTIAPIHYVVNQLLGDHDTIINTTPAGEDPSNFIPERDVLMDMANADLIILNGAGFETWVDTVSLPDSILFDSSKIFEDTWIEYDEVVHSHGDLDDHSHEGFNGHTWIAPSYFQQQVTAIYEKLKTILTEEEQAARNLSANYQALSSRLTELDSMGRAVFEPVRGTTLVATHPPFDYVARAYGFTVFNIDIDPDAEEITDHIADEFQKIDALREQTPVTFLLWEEDISDVLESEVAVRQLTNIIFEPLDDVEDPDYFTGMAENYSAIAEILTAPSP